jgi:flavin reductase (DIM6/NTAB) family NADH-FMN oxidoreductase RutF
MNATQSVPSNTTAASAAVLDDFRTAMSLLASGVTVVTAGSGDDRRGLTATAVCSLSMSPPSLLACVNCFGEAHAAIEATGSFCVNILAQEDAEVSDKFAGRLSDRGSEKFEENRWMELETGAPVLRTALVAVDCEVYNTMKLETHTVFLGRVKGVYIGEKRSPLLHFDRHYCSVASD